MMMLSEWKWSNQKAGMGAGHLAIRTVDMLIIHHKDKIVKVIDVSRQEVLKAISVGTWKTGACRLLLDGKHLYGEC
jgi:hypothetical protein